MKRNNAGDKQAQNAVKKDGEGRDDGKEEKVAFHSDASYGKNP
jgi:hypothetical protein